MHLRNIHVYSEVGNVILSEITKYLLVITSIASLIRKTTYYISLVLNISKLSGLAVKTQTSIANNVTTNNKPFVSYCIL